MFWTYVILPFCTMFVLVFFKSAQQLNVVTGKKGMVIPVSLCLATTEVLLVSTIATHGFGWICIPIGLGGGGGCIFSMMVYKKWFPQKDKND